MKSEDGNKLFGQLQN